MFERVDDRVSVIFSPEERSLLGQIPDLLDNVTEENDPGFAVLHRPLYPDDPDSSAELAGLIDRDLQRERDRDRSVISRIASGERTVSNQDARRFLRSINEARIVLAARAGAFEVDASWEQDISTEPALAAVAWLGYVQGELIEALSDDR